MINKFKISLKHLLIVNFLFLFTGCSTQNEKNDHSKKSVDKTEKKPNIIVILTDQERYPTHWPEG